jgi:hypothetical protein
MWRTLKVGRGGGVGGSGRVRGSVCVCGLCWLKLCSCGGMVEKGCCKMWRIVKVWKSGEWLPVLIHCMVNHSPAALSVTGLFVLGVEGGGWGMCGPGADWRW